MSSKVIHVRVKPDSKKDELISIEKNIYYISLKAPADKNKANVSLIKFLKKLTGENYKIKRGVTSRDKILERVI